MVASVPWAWHSVNAARLTPRRGYPTLTPYLALPLRREEMPMQFGLFMMPLHPPERSFTESYDRDLAQIVLADRRKWDRA